MLSLALRRMASSHAAPAAAAAAASAAGGGGGGRVFLGLDSSTQGIKATALLQDDGSYLLNGSKTFHHIIRNYFKKSTLTIRYDRLQ